MRRLDSIEIIIVGRIDRPIINGVITDLEVDVFICHWGHRFFPFFFF